MRISRTQARQHFTRYVPLSMSLEDARGAKTAESGEFFGVYPHLIGLSEMFLKSIFGSTKTLSFRASRRMNMGTYAMARKLKMENQYKGEWTHAARTKATGTGGSTYL